jgi:hypothetical protein
MCPVVTLHVPVIGKNGLLTEGGVWNVTNNVQHVNMHINAKTRMRFDRNLEINEQSAM